MKCLTVYQLSLDELQTNHYLGRANNLEPTVFGIHKSTITPINQNCKHVFQPDSVYSHNILPSI